MTCRGPRRPGELHGLGGRTPGGEQRESEDGRRASGLVAIARVGDNPFDRVRAVRRSGSRGDHLVQDILVSHAARIVRANGDSVLREEIGHGLIGEHVHVVASIDEPPHELRLDVVGMFMGDQQPLHVADRCRGRCDPYRT